MVDEPTSVDAFVAAGHELFDGSVSWPTLVLREPILRRNFKTMVAYARQHGMLFAPHGKTSVALKLFKRQLDDGVWGIAVAIPSHHDTRQ